MSPNLDSFVTHDGERIFTHQWPSTSQGNPDLHWAHANGFHARTYDPLIEQLSQHFRVRAWDMRGHGQSRSAGKPGAFKGWKTYYKDLVAMLDQSPEPLWLAGHSVGATTSLAAACQRPEKVKGLVLVEPVLFGRSVGLVLQAGRLFGLGEKLPMASAAIKRRAVFKSREEAFNNYRRKSAFASWTDDWLKAYVQHGLIEKADGSFELACTPQWESLSFQHTEPDSMAWMKAPPCPIHIIAGNKGSTFQAGFQPKVKNRLKHATVEIIEGASHFLPMEHTETLVQRLLALRAEAGAR